MKRIIALILAAAMLIGLVTTVGATNSRLEEREMYYYPIEYNIDAFATYAEILEYGVFDSVYTFPEKDLAGNPLDTTAPWFGYKGLDKITPGNVVNSKSIFLIDSIEGVEGGKVSAEAYTSATNYTKRTVTKTLQINGVDNYELQSTEANGAKNYIYNAGEMKYKFGPIGGTGDRLTKEGGHNVRLLSEDEKYKFTRTQDGAKKLGALFTLVRNNEGTSYAALEKAVITYNDGRAAETKYLVMTAMNSDADIYANATSDGDRLGRVVVAVPKKDSAGTELDHKNGAVLKANAKILSEKTSEEIAGKKLTIEDVTFPSDFVVGKSMPIADYVIARNSAVHNDRRYCPQGYANHFEFDFGIDVTSVEYQGGISYAKTYPGAVLNNQVAYIPVTIEGASEDYLYYARFGRPCKYTVALLAASSSADSLKDQIDALEARIEALDVPYNPEQQTEIAEIMSAIEALKTKGVLDTDFEDALITKLDNLYAVAEEAIKAELIDKVEKKISEIEDKYSASMKGEIESIKADIKALEDKGVTSANYDPALFAKFNKLYEVYELVSAHEDMVNGWGAEYLYSMHNDVKAAKEFEEGLKENEGAAEDAIASDVTAKLEKMYALLEEAKDIDDSISELNEEYNRTMLETLMAINESIDKFKANGGTDNGINPDNLEKFNKLYKDAEEDRILQAKEEAIKAFEDSVKELADKYTSSMREAVEKAIENYDAALALEVTDSDFDDELLAKFKGLREVYAEASKIEDTVAKWPATYGASYYKEVNEVKIAYDVLDEIGEADTIEKETADKINKFAALAKAAKEVDEKIAALPGSYEESIITELKKIKKEIDNLCKEGASDAAFENISKFNKLYAVIEEERAFLKEAQGEEYLEIPFTNDGFATAAEVYKYYPRDDNASNFPTKDIDGNPITNHVKESFKTKSFNAKIFLIDSILGNANGQISGEYLNTADQKTSSSFAMHINGNSKFKLQSTGADGTMNFLYNHNGVNFKMGPIGGTGAHLTATGGYNVHVLPNTVEAYKAEGKVANPTSVNILMSTDTVNGAGWAGLFPVKITYADGSTLTKYVLSTVLLPASMSKFMAEADDGDRLAKTVIYVPKTTDISTGASIAAAEKVLSKTNSEEVTGKALTLDDVKFPNDDLIIKGESVLFGDFRIARSNAIGNGRQYCPVGYVDYLSIPVEKKVASVQMARDINAALNWKDESGDAIAVHNGNCAYIPVEIEGASDDYYYFAKLGRLCQNEQEVYAVTVAGKSLQQKITEVEEMISELSDEFNEEDIEKLGEIKSAIDELAVSGVEEYDYDLDLYEKFNNIYESPEAKEAIDAYVYNNPKIVSVEKYTDLDNMTYTVKFSAPITKSSVTKELFSVTKNGESFSAYEVKPVKTEEEIYAVEVVIPNDYNYTDVYNLTVSKKIMGMGNSLKEGYTGEYDAPQAVQAEVAYADGKGMVVLTNNMNKEQSVTAVVALYGSDNQMLKRYIISKKLAEGESIEKAIEFQHEEGQKVECLVLNDFVNSRKVYNTYIFD